MKKQQLSLQARSGYKAGPPWIFSGRAFYQLHLVKADVARKFIPSDLKIVQAFGYTLGGLYLAQYDDSPAGSFDELVVIAGTVWNPPTSCAWAARVLVNSKEACDHGKKEVGLPSRFAEFSKVVKPIEQRGWFWKGPQGNKGSEQSEVRVVELDGYHQRPLCQILLPANRSRSELKNQRHGPSVSLCLPSFSGRTKEQPQLLKYSCQLHCSVEVVKPAVVTALPVNEGYQTDVRDSSYKLILSLLAAKPLLAVCFENMLMHVKGASVVNSYTEALSHKPGLKSSSLAPHKSL